MQLRPFIETVMAEQAHPKFQRILVFKKQVLGRGSYGAVYRAKCDDLHCAAKLLHPTLFDHDLVQQASKKGHCDRIPIKRFEQECELMSAIRHPNVVQYLGTSEDTETHLPLLLMELMDGSLTDFIQNNEPVPIPYHIQVNICHDITLALSFLHSNKIIHRDLSGKNVLMIFGNIRAKVTDFGMARLSDLIHPQNTQRSLTQCPGTQVYMPPEAVKEKPVYTEKMDCFSFGVILVQILTLQFPEPGDRRKEIEDHRYPSGLVEVRIPEIERRQNHISKIVQNHPLLSIALKCLKDDANERPSAQELCTEIETVKSDPKYRESQETSDSQRIRGIIKNKDQTIAQKDQELAEKNEIITATQNENQQLKQRLKVLQLDQEQRQQAIIKEKDQMIALKEQAVIEKDNTITAIQIENHRLIQQLRSLQLDQRSVGIQVDIEKDVDEQHIPGHDSIGLTWAYAEDAPCKMNSPFSVAFDKHSIQIRDTNDAVYAYHLSRKVWSKLPDSPTTNCPSVIINNTITLVGGYYGGTITNKCFSLVAAEGMYTESKLFNFTWEDIDWKWMEVFPPMLNERCDSAALSTDSALIVAGGDVLSIEVMSIVTRQWSVITDLPKLFKYPSAVICGNSFYILDRSTRSVYSCSLTKLLLSKPKLDKEETTVRSATVFQHKDSSFLEQRRRNAVSLRIRRSGWYERRPPAQRRNQPSDSEEFVWNKLADLPIIRSTCISFCDRLLSIGGEELEDYRPTNAVHIYDPILDSWKVMSHMSIARYNSFVAILPDNQLMVIGGIIDLGNPTARIEIATVH